MKKLLVMLMLAVGCVSYSWDNFEKYNYNIEENVQWVYSKTSDYNTGVMLSQFDGDILTFTVTTINNYGAFTRVKLFLDDDKISDGTAIKLGKGLYSVEATKEMIRRMKNGKELVVVIGEDEPYNAKCSLIGFTKSFDKLKNIKFLD